MMQENPYLMVAGSICIGDDIFIEEDHLNGYIETYFDVDRRFGLETVDTMNYVNLYADYYPDDDRLVVTYIIVHNDGENDEDYEVQDLANSERELIIRLMNKKCEEENDGLDMKAAFERQQED